MALNKEIFKYIKGFEDYIAEANYNPIKVMGLFDYYEFDKSKLEEEKNEFISYIKNNFYFLPTEVNNILCINYLDLAILNANDESKWVELTSYDNLLVLDKFFTLLVYYGFIKFDMYDFCGILEYYKSLIKNGYKLNMFLDGTEYIEGIKDYTDYICKNVLEQINFKLNEQNFELKK